jgi:hypothetical protein
MATIDFRGWRIQSDPECWTVGKPKLRINSKKQQEIYLAQPTYYPTLDQALAGVMQRELRASDAATAAEVVTLLRELKAEITKLLGAPDVS